MNQEDIKYFQRFGFIHYKGLLSPEEMAVISDAFDEGMRHKPAGIALTKADLLGPDADFEDPFADLRAPRFLISAVSGRGVPEMLRSVGQAVKKLRADEVRKDDS